MWFNSLPKTSERAELSSLISSCNIFLRKIYKEKDGMQISWDMKAKVFNVSKTLDGGKREKFATISMEYLLTWGGSREIKLCKSCGKLENIGAENGCKHCCSSVKNIIERVLGYA